MTIRPGRPARGAWPRWKPGYPGALQRHHVWKRRCTVRSNTAATYAIARVQNRPPPARRVNGFATRSPRNTTLLRKVLPNSFPLLVGQLHHHNKNNLIRSLDLNDEIGHYEQSSDDRSYREYCNGTPERPGGTGFKYDIRSDTKTIHWRWKETTGGQWRAYFNNEWLGPVGEDIVRVADTVAAWYEYRPPPGADESEFAIVIACTSSGAEEMDVHYHH